MSKQQLSINGNNIYERYGAQLLDGAFTSLIAFPKLKPYPKNDWQERSGIETDLSNPKLDKKEIKLSLIVKRYRKLIKELSKKVYHDFEFHKLEHTCRLRLINADVVKYNDEFKIVTLTLSNDFPLNGYQYSKPQSSINENDYFTIDDISTTAYGINILQGTLSQILKVPKIKPLMERNIKAMNGVIYDDKGSVTFKEKDVSLKCLMRADNIKEFWQNWNAFIYDLTKPYERTLYVKALDKKFSFCYKSSMVSKFYTTPYVWVEFTVVITFTYNREENNDDIF